MTGRAEQGQVGAPWHLDGGTRPRNVLVVWLRHLGEFRGAVRVADKIGGDFDPEDLRLLSILANNFAVALDNVALYGDLRRKMQELREAQQQLIQAAKLAAIGELASNVAHEINNPLTSIIGFSQLLMETEVPDDIREDLKLINTEPQRAVMVTRNFLTFARKARSHEGTQAGKEHSRGCPTITDS